MIWHPLVWTFWAAAAAGGLLYAAAAVRAMDVAANWAPMQTDPPQLRRERHAETAALMARGSMVCLWSATLIGVGGIALVWHRLIPGAMCGTGVLQAMGPAGHRAMLFWGAASLLLYGWRTLDRLDRRRPQGVLVPTGARLLLTAAPFVTLALAYSWQALMRMESAPPVSCCAVVYDRVLNEAAASGITAVLAPAARWGSLAGMAAVPLAVMLASRRPPVRPAGAFVASLAMGWSVLAAASVKHIWSAYYYHVLSHPCPWCLLLPDHHGAGAFIFACLAAVNLEGAAFWVADHACRNHPVLAGPAGRRRRTAAWRITAAVIVFAILTVGPAAAWRMGTGVWMDGSF